VYLYEFEAKNVFKNYGIPLAQSGVATSPQEAREIFDELGKPAMVKAQVMAGGRGKAGLILPVNTSEDAQKAAETILGRYHQGEKVQRVLVEEQIKTNKEAYASITMDFAAGMPVVMVSSQGGVEIESVAQTQPDKIAKLYLNPWLPLHSFQLRELAIQAGLRGKIALALEDILGKMIKIFNELDAVTVEINPLIITEDERVFAADGKLITDEEAAFRIPELNVVERERVDAYAQKANEINVTYVSLDPQGTIGIIAGGAGLSMATMDAVYALEGKPAAFIDLGGGISRERMKETLVLMARTPGLEGIILNVFGGINNCLTMAQGLADFMDEEHPKFQLVVKMRGHEQEEGWRILEHYNIPTVKLETTDVAIRLLMQTVQEEGRSWA